MLNRKFAFREDTEINGIEETSQLNSNETLLANTYDSLHSFVSSLRVILDKGKDEAESFNDSTTEILDKVSILIKFILNDFIGSYSAFIENSTTFKTMYHLTNKEVEVGKIIVKYLTPELTLQIETMLEMLGSHDIDGTFINKYDNNKIPLDDVKNLLIKIMLEFYNSIRKAGPQFVCRYLIDIIENELKYLKEGQDKICVTNNLLTSTSTQDVLYGNVEKNTELINEYSSRYESTLISIAINLRNILSNTTEPYISSQEIEKMNSTTIKTSVTYSIIQDVLMKARLVCSEFQLPKYNNFITYQAIFSQNPEFLTLLAQLSKHEVTFMEIIGKTYEILKVAPSIPKILNIVGQMVSNSSAMFSMTIPNKFRTDLYPIEQTEEQKMTIDGMFKEIYKLCVVNSFSNSMDNVTQNSVKDKFSKFAYMLERIIATITDKHEGPTILSFRILYLSVLISKIYIQEALFFNGEDKNESIETLFKLKMSTEEIIEYFKEFGIQIEKYMVEQYQKWLDALYTKLKEFTQGNVSLSDRSVAEMVLKLYILLLGRVATYLNNENHKILQIKLRTGLATAEKKFLKATVNIKEESRSYEMRLKQLTAKNRDSIDNGFSEIPLGDALKEIIKDQQISNLKIKYCCIFVLSTYQRFIPGNEDTIYDILGFDFAELNNFSFDY